MQNGLPWISGEIIRPWKFKIMSSQIKYFDTIHHHTCADYTVASALKCVPMRAADTKIHSRMLHAVAGAAYSQKRGQNETANQLQLQDHRYLKRLKATAAAAAMARAMAR